MNILILVFMNLTSASSLGLIFYLLISNWKRESLYPPCGPLPSQENILFKNEYTCSFSFRYRQPNWVAERLTRMNLISKVNRADMSFHRDPELPDRYQPHYSDYSGSRMSQGHLAMAHLHSRSREAIRETFSYANISPQEVSMNSGEWLRIEEWLIGLLKRQHRDSVVYVVSGPIWRESDSSRCIGGGVIPVPTDFFKVVHLAGSDGSSACVGFIVPNVESVGDKEPGEFIVDIDSIESQSGLDLSAMKSEHQLFNSPAPAETPKDEYNWRLTWRLKIACTIDEVRSVVRVAIKRNHFNKSNLLLIEVAKQKVNDLCEDEDVVAALAPGHCRKSSKYREALLYGLSLLD